MSDNRLAHLKGVLRLIDPAEVPQVKRWLSASNGRTKFLRRLQHNIGPHPQYAFRPERSKRDDDSLVAQLVALGAPKTCYIIASDNDDYDDSFADLNEMVHGAGHEFEHGTFLSCIPGRLAMFRGAELGQNLIVHRPD